MGNEIRQGENKSFGLKSVEEKISKLYNMVMKDNRKRKRTSSEKKRISEGTIKGIANARNRGITIGRPATAQLAIQQNKHMIIFLQDSGVPQTEIAAKVQVARTSLGEYLPLLI